MQIEQKINTAPPESQFDKMLEQGLFRYTLKLAQILNKGIGIDNLAETWDDFRVPGHSTKTGSSAPNLVAFGPSGNLFCLAFNGAATLEQVYFAMQLPHHYKEGSDIRPHVHWTPTTNDAGNVKWQFEYFWANAATDVFGAPTTLSVVDAASGAAWTHQKSFFPVISGTGKKISSMLMCRLFRDPSDAADTYAHEAAFLEFDFHYQVDSTGSQQIAVKLF